jgi:16S rRNA (uracil1498-N3)-methyltransferase
MWPCVDVSGDAYYHKNIDGDYVCKMKRFFIDRKLIIENTARIRGPQAHHIRDVIRLGPGDRFTGLDNEGRIYTMRIKSVEGDILADIEDISLFPKEECKVLLACAVSKKNKMDYIVEKSTELGVTDIIPMMTDRTIVKLSKAASDRKQARWQRIAIEATKQSGRAVSPNIHNISDFRQALNLTEQLGYRNRIIPYVAETELHIIDCILDRMSDIAVFIGPEGDFTEREICLAKNNGIKPVSLGQAILKVDTACLFALSLISAYKT